LIETKMQNIYYIPRK